MCGIAGKVTFNGRSVEPDRLRAMRDAISHRGPDDFGQLCKGQVGIANRRLSIIDLTPAGRQPMSNEDGSIHLVYNGEVYNFRELREELEAAGHVFRSRTDTEVVLHAYEEWGVECLRRFDGMFSFCIWDEKERSLFLARDRYGIKPLYYSSRDGEALLFGSEVKSILAEGSVRPALDTKALREYFTFQNLYSDRTLFEGVRLLPPGSYMLVDLETGRRIVARYWDFDFRNALSPSEISLDECAERVRELFERAVERQLVSDVPLGSFLSGGMDSGSIVAVASRMIPRLMTFTGGFDLRHVQGLEAAYDEREAAEAVASSFSTEHYEMVIHAGDMQWVMPKLVWHLEDLRLGMCYQNYYIQRLASKFVKVVLSGAGGDELFGGYPWRYDRIADARDAAEFGERYFDYWQRLVPVAEHGDCFSETVMNEAGDYSPREVFDSLIAEARSRTKPGEVLDAALYFELRTFLHGLFVIVDKLSMANSLEARVPYLDNALVDFALKVPSRYKYAGEGAKRTIDDNVSGKKHIYYNESNEGKRVLREAMKGLLPSEILSRNKLGFSPPEGSWYRGPTMGYVRDTLLGKGSVLREYFREEYVRRIVEEHTGGRRNHRLLLWSLLSFEWWCRVWLQGGGRPPRN